MCTVAHFVMLLYNGYCDLQHCTCFQGPWQASNPGLVFLLLPPGCWLGAMPNICLVSFFIQDISEVESMQVYDSSNGLLAPRIWWSLAYHGHPAPLVLDGGYAKWLEEGRPAELAEPCPIGLSPDMRQWHQGCASPPAGAPPLQPDAGRTTKVCWQAPLETLVMSLGNRQQSDNGSKAVPYPPMGLPPSAWCRLHNQGVLASHVSR